MHLSQALNFSFLAVAALCNVDTKKHLFFSLAVYAARLQRLRNNEDLNITSREGGSWDKENLFFSPLDFIMEII